jgi:PilZ domain
MPQGALALDRRVARRERRTGPRARFVAAVRAFVDHVELALARNLGEDGMELRRARAGEWPEAQPVALSFELPDGGELVEVRGAVVFERAEGRWWSTGVRFEGLSVDARARIQRYVSAR